jgi:hypothetical protein
LGNAQRADDIADAEFSALLQEPQDFQAGLIRQGFEKSGLGSHFYFFISG